MVMVWKMMIMLLLILFFMTIIAYVFGEFDIISPAFVVPATFTFCVGLAAIYTDTWNLPMHFDTAVIILVMVLFFEIGVIYSSCVCDRNKDHNNQLDRLYTYTLSNRLFLLFISSMAVIAWLNYQELFFISRQFTLSTDLGVIIGATIHQLQLGNVEFSRWNSYRSMLAQGMTYVSLFAFLNNAICRRKIIITDFKFLVIVFLYAPILIFTGGRQQVIYLTIYTLVLGVFLYRLKNGFLRSNGYRLIGVGILALSIFIGLFYILGILSGKIRESYTITRVLAHYAGTNISALDYFINQGHIPDTGFIGTMTLTGIYSWLRVIGFELPEVRTYISTFVQFDGITTNVYTALRRYIQDYGYVGCGMIMLLLGMLYQAVYNYLKHKFNYFALILYSFYCYPIFLLCREERFMTNILSTTTIYMLICVYITYKVLQKNELPLKGV